MVIGPAWTRGEIEKPAGTKNMGSWTAAVYTPEQQARLGVDESGNKVPDLAQAAAPPKLPKLGATCGAIGPAWTRGEIEKPAGTKNMGSWTAAVYTPEQQARLGVDESGNKVPDLAKAAAPPKLCGAIGPAWTRGEIEKPAGTKNMGSWTSAVYTPEQQARLGVDESGNKVPDLAKAAAPPKLCGAIGPAWTRGEIEKPAGTKNMGSWTAAVYTPEQQARLGVDEFGKKVADPAKAAAPPKLGATLGSIGPAWTRGEIEKPAGTKTMDTFAGSWTAAVYTPEQQARLGVDESGKKVPDLAQAAAPPKLGATCGAIGPAWTRGEIEKPAGTKNMGSWTAAVYTEEQQARLGVDEEGKPVAKKAKASSPADTPLSPEYIAALMMSDKLFADLCKKHFRKYDTNKDGLMELDETTKLCQDLHNSMGLPVDEESIKAATESTKQFAEGEDKSTLSEEEFARWFRELLKESIGKHVEKQVPLPKMEMLTVKVKSLGGTEKEVEVPADCTVSMLAEAAAAELDLPYAQTKISVNGEVVPDSALLSSLELGSDPEVTAVVMDTIKVRRHVYNMRGGGPERRGYALLATDEVELPPRAKLADHLDKLVPQEGYSHRRPEEFDLKAFQATPSSQVPKKWQGGMNEVDVDLDATAEQVFGVDGHVELSVLVPMRGLD